MKVLSLFDGMSCGMIAFKELGIEPERYVAYEIDKYAIQTSVHNFPIAEHKGDVFAADFTEYRGFDWLVGGSPCTYWSIAQKKNRETVASGIGWELFSQYVRALHEAKPKFFLYENNKSMSKEIRASITKTFGFEPICINSALVSAQNRQRLYWVGIKRLDGTYARADLTYPEDRRILLKDILEANSVTWQEKGYALTASSSKGDTIDHVLVKHNRNMVAERISYYGIEDKSRPLIAGYSNKGDGEGSVKSEAFPDNPNKQVFDYVAEPINVDAQGKSRTLKAQYYKNGIANFITNDGFDASAVAEPIRVGTMPSPNGELKGGQAMRVYSTEGKSVTLKDCGGGNGAKTGLYAIEQHDLGLNKHIYEVKDGMITVKGSIQ